MVDGCRPEGVCLVDDAEPGRIAGLCQHRVRPRRRRPTAPARLSSAVIVAGPITPATPGCFASSVCKRARLAVSCVTPLPSMSTSVGDTMPTAKPFPAAACARAGWESLGSAVTSGAPSLMPAAPSATASSASTHAATMTSATGLVAANLATPSRTRHGDRGGGCGLPSACARAARRAAFLAFLNQCGPGQNKAVPKMPISAGASVSETTIAVSTVTASAGPNALTSCTFAIASAAVPAATRIPAARMIGANSAVVSRAACSFVRPSARRTAPRPKAAAPSPDCFVSAYLL